MYIPPMYLCHYVFIHLKFNVAMGLYHFIGSAVYITTYLWMCSAFIIIVAQKIKCQCIHLSCDPHMHLHVT